MGAIMKLIDTILFLFLLMISFTTPLLDAQLILPSYLFPDFLINLNNRHIHDSGNYLFKEKPSFFLGFIWVNLLYQWPLVLCNLYGILTSKPWLGTTLLLYGSSFLTGLAVLAVESTVSGRESDKLKRVYYPFMILGVLAILRGLMAESSKNTAPVIIGKQPVAGLSTKKRA